jgi:hypothetical protein
MIFRAVEPRTFEPRAVEPRAVEPEDIKYPLWQEPLLKALIETDREVAQMRLAEAKAAIHERLETISQDETCKAEQQAIQDASSILRVLENEHLKAS